MSTRQVIELWCVAMGLSCKYIGDSKWDIYRGTILVLENVDADSFVYEEKYTP